MLTRGDPAAADPAYRLFDEHGNVLVLRSDMTIPIARVVATRYADRPSRRCASATSRTPTAACARSAASRGSSCRPAIELVGAPGARGHGRGARRAVRGARRRRACRATGSGLGDASLYPALLTRAGVDAAPRLILHELVTRDFVGLEREVERSAAGARCAIARSCAAAPRCSTGVAEAEPLRALLRPARARRGAAG